MASSPIDTIPAHATTRGDTLTGQQRLDMLLSHLPSSAAPDGFYGAQGMHASSATRGELTEEIERINTAMRAYGVEFQLDDFDGRVITRIVDRASGDLIRQIPCEEVLRIAQAMEQLQGRLITLRV
ncbi:flagellar protein FlaG [Halomonas shantousis]